MFEGGEGGGGGEGEGRIFPAREKREGRTPVPEFPFPSNDCHAGYCTSTNISI